MLQVSSMALADHQDWFGGVSHRLNEARRSALHEVDLQELFHELSRRSLTSVESGPFPFSVCALELLWPLDPLGTLHGIDRFATWLLAVYQPCSGSRIRLPSGIQKT